MPEPNSGCWLWLGSDHWHGYGYFQLPGRITVRAHRAAMMLYRGFDLRSPLQVLHRCDVPCCVNPDHLFLGTNADNRADMVNKKRQTRGEAHPRAKLTAATVKRIFSDPLPSRAAGVKYGVSHTTIKDIRKQKIWRHVTNEF